jgi:hypothetical protein
MVFVVWAHPVPADNGYALPDPGYGGR